MRYANLVYGFVAGMATLAACGDDGTPDAYGHLEATDVVVAAQATGQLAQFRASEGMRLAAGEVAAVIEVTALDLQLQQIAAQRTASESRVNEVTKQIAVLEAQAAITRRSYERARRLYDTLSQATVETLHSIGEPIEVVVFLSASDPLTVSVRPLH